MYLQKVSIWAGLDRDVLDCIGPLFWGWLIWDCWQAVSPLYKDFMLLIVLRKLSVIKVRQEWAQRICVVIYRNIVYVFLMAVDLFASRIVRFHFNCDSSADLSLVLGSYNNQNAIAIHEEFIWLGIFSVIFLADEDPVYPCFQGRDPLNFFDICACWTLKS